MVERCFVTVVNRGQHIHGNRKQWNTELIAGDQKLEKVKIKILKTDKIATSLICASNDF